MGQSTRRVPEALVMGDVVELVRVMNADGELVAEFTIDPAKTY